MSGSEAPPPSPPQGEPDRPPEGRQELAGKVALVTGGGGAIGRAIAVLFASRGARIVVAGRRAEPLQETVREIRRIGGTATFTRGDVGRADRVEMIVQAATYNFGGLDVVVHAAGQSLPGTITDIEERRWDRVMSTNLKGPYLVSRQAVAALRERGGGSIIHVAGISGLTGVRAGAALSASKGGLIALTRSMALDLGPDRIRVNAICPGPMEEGARPSQDSPGPPLGRRGRSEDVAGLALYLASDESMWVTGGIFPVDGGLLAGAHV